MSTYTQNVPTPSLLNGKHSQPFPTPIDFRKWINTTSMLESKLLEQLEFKIGLNWGVPRFGHPEGKVGFHIAEVLKNIEQLGINGTTRQRLRITALSHDTFKYKESETIAQGKRINHGLLARRFMEKFIDDEITLDLIELHDEIYYAWRHEALQGSPKTAEQRLADLIERVGENLTLHYLFFRCDTMTGDKIQAPRFWFEQKVKEVGGKEFKNLLTRLNGHH